MTRFPHQSLHQHCHCFRRNPLFSIAVALTLATLSSWVATSSVYAHDETENPGISNHPATPSEASAPAPVPAEVAVGVASVTSATGVASVASVAYLPTIAPDLSTITPDLSASESTLHRMRIDRLERLANYLETIPPYRFNISSWGSGDPWNDPCFKGCALSHGVVVFHSEGLHKTPAGPPKYGVNTGWDAAMAFFGLSDPMVKLLFSGPMERTPSEEVAMIRKVVADERSQVVHVAHVAKMSRVAHRASDRPRSLAMCSLSEW